MTPPSDLPPRRAWHERLNVFSVALVTFALGIAASLPALRGSGRSLDYIGNIKRLLGAFLPPDWSVWQETLSALAETFQIAICATALATLLSIPLAALGARTIAPVWVVVPVRLVMNAARTVPSLIWALIGVAIVGANPLAGVIGLTFYSVGYLGKFISDAFESVDADVARGLRTIGADRVQAFQFGLWPHARPLVVGHVLWMLEYNLRAASIIGYVGAGGLGLQLASYYEYYAWSKVATVLIFILALVTLLDFAGEAMRRSITRHLGAK
ncbi:MAG: phosphonate ABC transporter, permease protein PhnE [Opitutaceae bacterium]|nr:phosphonate ABC transporter, permease protein PhnE [Opitutaceae bacterium]